MPSMKKAVRKFHLGEAITNKSEDNSSSESSSERRSVGSASRVLGQMVEGEIDYVEIPQSPGGININELSIENKRDFLLGQTSVRT
jgi:hypothetical protein